VEHRGARVLAVTHEAGGDPWRVGATIDDRWEIFGSEDGGIGRVFFVRDRRWDAMPMAVKTLKAASGDASATRRELFRRETQTWLDLGAHPHIVSGFYTLELDRALRFFMEFVPGKSLEQRVLIRRPSIEETLDLAIQIAFGMEYVHARGVVHRDLKPANCLVLNDGTLRVTDFGLGRSLGETEGTGLPIEIGTRALGSDDVIERMGAGTPVYMAPEQWRALHETRKPADVYSCGVVLYELLAGTPPFSATDACFRRYRGRVAPPLDRLLHSEDPIPNVVLRCLHEEADPLPLRDLSVAVPGPLEIIVRRCLDKDPQRRPAFGQLREMLLDLFEHVLGRPYARRLDAGLEPSEAGENNRAVSYQVMGNSRRATHILDGWLAVHPLALYPWINRRIAAVEEGAEDAAAFAAKLVTVMRPAHVAAFEQDRQVTGLCARLRPVLLPLGAPIDMVAVSPDSAYAVLVGPGSLARVHALYDGAVVAELRGHEHRVVSAAFSPDGQRLVTGSWDRTARVWRVADRGAPDWACESVLHGPRAWTTCVAWSPDGAHVLTGSEDGSALVWDPSSGRTVLALERHESSVQAIAWSPDGAWLLTGTRDGLVRAFRFPGGERARELPAHDGHVAFLAFLTNTQAISAGRDGIVRSFDVIDDEVRVLLSHGEGLLTAAVSTLARLLATGSRDGHVRVWRLDSGTRVRDIEAHEGPVRSVVFVGEGGRVLSGSEDGSARLWGSRAPKPLAGGFAPLICAPLAASERVSLAQRRDDLVARLARGDVTAYAPLQGLRGRVAEYERDPEILAALARVGHAHGVCTGVRDLWVSSRFSIPSQTTCLSFTSEGRILAGGDDGTLRAHGLEGRIDVEFRPPFEAGGVTAVASSATDVAAAFTEQVAVLWSLDGQNARVLEGHTKAVRAIALSTDGARVATGSDDRSVRLWQRDGSLLRVLEGHRGPVVAVAFTPDDRSVLTASTDGFIRLFSLDTDLASELVHVVGARLESAAFHRDGRLAAVRTSKSIAQQYDLASGKLVGSIPGHTYFASPLCFSPRGRMLVTGSNDFTDHSARLWDASTAALIRTFDPQASPISAAAIADDGLRIATGSRDGSIVSWELDYDWRFNEDALTEAEPPTEIAALPSRACETRTLATSEKLLCGAFSPTADVLALGGRGGLSLGETNGTSIPLEGGGLEVLALSWSPDGARLAAASERAVRVFSIGSQRVELQIASAGDAITSLALARGLLVVGTRGSRSLVFTADGALLHTLGGHTDAITGVAVNADETRIVTASLDGTLRLWSAAGGAAIGTFAAHAQGALCARFLGEDRLLSGGCDGRACIWDLEGHLVSSFQGSVDDVTALALRADGRVLATSGRDRCTRLWDVESGAELFVIPGARRIAVSLSFSPSGRLLVLAGKAQVLQLE